MILAFSILPLPFYNVFPSHNQTTCPTNPRAHFVATLSLSLSPALFPDLGGDRSKSAS